jgi:hypothetical protein
MLRVCAATNPLGCIIAKCSLLHGATSRVCKLLSFVVIVLIERSDCSVSRYMPSQKRVQRFMRWSCIGSPRNANRR